MTAASPPIPVETEQDLAGWGRLPVERCAVARPDALDALRRLILDGPQSTYIPRGLGRSYGDPALNRQAGVITQTRLNHFLDFDPDTGRLVAEPGVSLADVLAHLLPRGWFVATTPGTRFVTLGGAVAADVHGKNHHIDGSFGRHVRELDLMLADGSIVTCSPDRRPDLFHATLGGMGLTGVITRLDLQLRRAPSAYCRVSYRRAADLDEAIEQLAATEADYRYSVAWVDALATGRSLGRSVLMLGNDAEPDDLPLPRRDRPHALPTERRRSVPCDAPAWLLNRLAVAAFNTAFYTRHRDHEAIVDYGRFFYPLDAVAHWNRLYGRRGFVQYQVLLPLETARAGLIAVLEQVAAWKKASFLTVLKKAGPAADGPLSYMFPGYTLALDLPNTGDDLRRLTARLDRLLLDHGGRLYLAKDATMAPETFAAMYPRLDEFRRVKDAVDPNHRFVSSQARRVGIVEP